MEGRPGGSLCKVPTEGTGEHGIQPAFHSPSPAPWRGLCPPRKGVLFSISNKDTIHLARRVCPGRVVALEVEVFESMSPSPRLLPGRRGRAYALTGSNPTLKLRLMVRAQGSG